MTDRVDQNEHRNILELDVVLSQDFEAPIRALCSVGYTDLSSAYMAASAAAEEGQQPTAQKVHRMLADLCGFHFKPEDQAEPYGPMAQFGGRRTAIPADFSGEQSKVFARLAPHAENPALKARLADVAWLADRKDRQSAIHAIEGFCESVERVLNSEAFFEGGREEAHTWLGIGFLRRALNIAHMTDFTCSAALRAKNLLQLMREAAFANKDRSVFRPAVVLDRQYRISKADILVAETLEMAQMSNSLGNLDDAREYWQLAGGIFSTEKNHEKHAQCLCLAADCYVREAAGAIKNTFLAVHLLTKAIEQYRVVPKKYRSTKVIEQLQKELVYIQRNMPDELQTISKQTDIQELVQQIEQIFAGKSFSQKIASLVTIDQAKPYEFYEAQHLKNRKGFPLSTLFEGSMLDGDGKVKARSSADHGVGDVSEDAVKEYCAQAMSLDHQLAVEAALEPARSIFLREHTLYLDLFVALASMSPFVPEGHEHIFGIGLFRYFSGSMIEAGSILIPQLENSLRYILRLHGHDVTKLNSDMTQEEINLSTMLGRLRTSLEEILGAPRVLLIEMVFDHRHGPNLRNALAHGNLRSGHFQSVQMIYACWMIFELVCYPLFHDWEKVEQATRRFYSE